MSIWNVLGVIGVFVIVMGLTILCVYALDRHWKRPR